jgi:hypothetical protein
MTLTLIVLAALAQPFGLWLALRLVAPRAPAAPPAPPPHAEFEICLRAPKSPRVPREFLSGEWS